MQGSKGSSDVTSSHRLWSVALRGHPGLFAIQESQGPESRLPRSLRQCSRGGLFLLCPCPEAFALRPCVLAAFTDWLSPPHAPSPGPSLLLVVRNTNAACPTWDIHQGHAPWGALRGPGGCPSVLVHGHLFFVCSLGRQRPQPRSMDSCPSTRPLGGVLAVGTWWAVTHCQCCWRPLLGLRWCFLPPTAPERTGLSASLPRSVLSLLCCL